MLPLLLLLLLMLKLSLASGCASGLHFRPALCTALVSLAAIVVNCIAMVIARQAEGER